MWSWWSPRPLLPRCGASTAEGAGQRAAGDRARSVPDSLNYLNAADLVVAMAGYNTTAEILSWADGRCSCPGPDRVPNNGCGPAVSPHGAGSTGSPPMRWHHTLAEAMLRTLRSAPFQPDEAPDLRGRERAVQHLLARGADVVDPLQRRRTGQCQAG